MSTWLTDGDSPELALWRAVSGVWCCSCVKQEGAIECTGQKGMVLELKLDVGNNTVKTKQASGRIFLFHICPFALITFLSLSKTVVTLLNDYASDVFLSH